MIKKLVKHIKAELFPHPILSKKVLQQIEQKNLELEKKYGNEVLIVIEKSLPLFELFSKVTPKHRALELFSLYRVWDTEQNDGILLYFLLAEKKIEIVADRAYNEKVAGEIWQDLCFKTSLAFQQGDYGKGFDHLLEQVFKLAHQHFKPAQKRNELKNRPIVLF